MRRNTERQQKMWGPASITTPHVAKPTPGLTFGVQGSFAKITSGYRSIPEAIGARATAQDRVSPKWVEERESTLQLPIIVEANGAKKEPNPEAEAL
jgi:hypothetical protein